MTLRATEQEKESRIIKIPCASCESDDEALLSRVRLPRFIGGMTGIGKGIGRSYATLISRPLFAFFVSACRSTKGGQFASWRFINPERQLGSTAGRSSATRTARKSAQFICRALVS